MLTVCLLCLEPALRVLAARQSAVHGLLERAPLRVRTSLGLSLSLLLFNVFFLILLFPLQVAGVDDAAKDPPAG